MGQDQNKEISQARVDACNAKGALDNIAAVLVRPGSAAQSG